MAASENPANPIGSTLIALARAIERLYEILQHPAVQTAYSTAPDQIAEGAPLLCGACNRAKGAKLKLTVGRRR